jgi:HEAT repeat protein
VLADPSPAVRSAALRVCLPILNIDRAAAVDAFLRACSHPDDRVLRGHYLNDFLSYTIHQPGPLEPLIRRMADSTDDQVAESGAAWATLAWLKFGAMTDVATACATGAATQRKGAAQVLAHHLSSSGWPAPAVERIEAFFGDAEPEVRHDAGEVFGVNGVFDQPRSVELARAFVASRAFADDPTAVFRGLVQHAGPLAAHAPVILDAADRFAGPLAEAARDMSQGLSADVGDLASLLLRLYQQAHGRRDAEMQNQCLDRWDALLRARVGYDLPQTLDE